MNILILSRIPFDRIKYNLIIDHSAVAVYYIGSEKNLEMIPNKLKCHRIFTPDLNKLDAKECIDILSKIPNAPKFDAIFAKSEYDLFLAADLRKLLGIAGPTRKSVDLLRDKIKMKDCIAQANIATPKYLDGEMLRGNNIIFPWCGSTIFKPKSGASSEGIKKFNSPEAALTYAQSLSSNSCWELEETIDAPILHLDGIVQNGKIKAFLGSRYVNSCLDFALGSPLGSYQFDTPTSYLHWTEKCLAALSYSDGAFHLEAFEMANGLVFLEAASRVGGADVAETFKLKTGLNIHLEDIRAFCEKWHPDLPLIATPLKNSFSPSYFGWFVFPNHVHWRLETYKRQEDSSQLKILEWNKMEIDFSNLKPASYHSSEAPLSGRIQSDTPKNIQDFLEELFATTAKQSGIYKSNKKLPLSQN